MDNQLTTKTYTEKSKHLLTDSKRPMVWQCYLMLTPQIIGFLILTIYPILWVMRLSWFYYDGVLSNIKYTGWENFIKLFTTDTVYWKTWLTTIKFALYKLPIELPLSFLLAMLLNRKMKGSGFFRSIYYLPNIISVAIVGLIFSNIFGYFGVINGILLKYGFIRIEIDWFANSTTAMIALILGAVWNTFGINVLYFLAALQNIPEELYECAKLDGAGRFVMVYKITIPMISPILQTIMLLAISGTLQVSDYILVTTNGAPSGETFTVLSYIVSKFVPGFAEKTVNIGYGCAISLVTSIIFCIIAITYMKLSKKLSNVY